MQARNLPHPRIVERTALACALALLAASVDAGTITVTHTGAASASTCTLGQAIYAANRANNPGNTTPSGATTIAPLSLSATTTIGVGTCAGATAGANTIQLPISATINFGSDTPDNFWYGPNALPPIASEIVIEGRGATLNVTLGTSPRLRFFYVGANPQSSATPGYNTPGAGLLTLRNLTLSGGRQVGGQSYRGGGGAGMGGAIFNQGSLSLQGVTLDNNQAIGGASGDTETNGGDLDGGGMGARSGGRSGMGGPVPAGTSDAGAEANATTGAGGAGGGTANGIGGLGGHHQTAVISSGGNGSGAGGSVQVGVLDPVIGGGGSGFGGGPGGASYSEPVTIPNGGGTFGVGGDFRGSGGGVGGGGGSSSLYGGGGGFAGGGGYSGNGPGTGGPGGKGGFGGGGSCPLAIGGYGGGKGHSIVACWGGGGGAGMGGAIFNHAGSVSIVNSTLAGNRATGGSSFENPFAGGGGSGFGGAVFNLNGSLHIAFSTLAGNSVAGGIGGTAVGYGTGAAFGGAVFSLAYNGAAITGSTAAALTLENSILANSTGGVDLAVDQPAEVGGGLVNAAVATTSATGTNLVMSTVVGGAAAPLPPFNTNNPTLGPLGNNGGPTRTMALLEGSPAIDAATGGTPPAIDQRGLGRPAGPAPDAGAFEFGAVGGALEITSTAPPNGSFGVAYSHTVMVSGTPAPSFSISAGALPPGLTLNVGSGVISGTPTSVGTSNGTITASNGVGTAATQNFGITIAAVVPGAPTGVVATRGNASVSVAFAAPASNGGSAIISYQASCGGQSTSGPASPIVVGNLTNGVAVTCTVIATNAAGNSAPSAASNSVTPATVPGAPTNLAATPGNGSASFQFNPPASNGGAAIIDYTVSCAPGNGQVTGAGSPLTLGGLTNGTTYACSVTARNGVGSGTASAPVNVIPSGAAASANLGITKTNGTGFVTGGAPTSYSIVVSNAGPSGVVGARVQDTLDPEFSNAAWTCVGQNGGSCPANGSGNLDELVDLPVGASAQFTLTAEVAALPETPVSNVASVTPPAGVSDPNLSNNVASDGPDTRGIFRAEF